MPTFNISTHALLSEKAKLFATGDADQKEIFDANVVGAELIHDLSGESFDKAERENLAKLILVYQVNFQFENDSNIDVYNSVKEGDKTFDYRDSAISSLAQKLREKLAEDMAGDTSKPKPKLHTSKNINNTVSW